jgi:hypothetical protein
MDSSVEAKVMRWFRRRLRVWKPEHVPSDNPLMRAVIAEAMNTGRAMMGQWNEDGTWEIKPFGPEPPDIGGGHAGEEHL